MTVHPPAVPVPAFLGTRDRPLPHQVARELHIVPPGEQLDCPETPWADALAILEGGCVELGGPSGGRLHLCRGAVFSLRGLTPAVVTSAGPDPAVIHTLHRRTEGEVPMTRESILDSDPAAFHRWVAAGFTARVEGVTDPAVWDRPAPVAGWTARDVVRHLVEWFPGFLSSSAGITLTPGPSVDDDPAGAWRAQCDQIQALLEDPETDERMLRDRHVGELPLGPAVSQFYTGDVFLHTWDLARATGQDETLDPALCAEMLKGMEPMEELLRSSGQYGPRVPVPDEADVQTRLIAFIGRDPYAGR